MNEPVAKKAAKTGGACAVRQVLNTYSPVLPHLSTGFPVSVGDSFGQFLGGVQYYVCDHCGCLFKAGASSQEGDESRGDGHCGSAETGDTQ